MSQQPEPQVLRQRQTAKSGQRKGGKTTTGPTKEVTEKAELRGPAVTSARTQERQRRTALLSAEEMQALPCITRAALAKHCTPKDAWLAIDGVAYNVTGFADRHPGGAQLVLDFAGRDATEAYLVYHPTSAHKWLKPLAVGRLAPAPATKSGDVQEGEDGEDDWRLPAITEGFLALKQELEERDMFHTDWRFYVFVVGRIVLCALVTAVLLCYNQIFLGAIMAGFFYQQAAFFGHDLGHSGVTHIRRVDDTVGYIIGNLLTGISISWWKRSHNSHHVATNSIHYDPDIQHLPVFAISPDFLPEFWSKYHNCLFTAQSAVARFFVRHQAISFYPVMAVARFNLYFQSFLHAVTRFRQDPADLITLIIYQILLFCVATWTGRPILFYLLSHAVAGILHVQICISHFPMCCYHGLPLSGAKGDDTWVPLHLGTTMNVSCPEEMDWFHGGLQFQIEHHLFPRLPRHNLRVIRPLVQRFCETWGIKYVSASFLDCNRRLIAALANVSAAPPKPTDEGSAGHGKKKSPSSDSSLDAFRKSVLYDGLMARG